MSQGRQSVEMDEDRRKQVLDAVCKDVWGLGPKAWQPSTSTLGQQFASTLLSGVLTLDVPVIIKTQPEDEATRRLKKSDDQFHNEVLVYRELLPLLGGESLTPRMYGGRAEGGAGDFVALQKMEGMEPCRMRPFLDRQHLEVILKKLGQFHALSYKAKAEGKLPGPAKRLREVGFSTIPAEEYTLWLKAAFLRAIDPFRGSAREVNEMIRALDDLPRVVEKLEEGSEPLNVLIHGDFCANNILFKYSAEGSVEDVVFIDFQTSRYSSPCLDLAFFLYLNTSAATREECWDSLLDTYLDSLESSLPDPALHPGRDAFFEEFSRKALYGLLHCSFFLPIMILKVPHPLYAEIFAVDDPRYVETMLSIGGQEATDAVAAIFKHLLDHGYIRAFLEHLQG